MNTINCLIVDDEELARVLLENYCQRLPNLHIVAQSANPVEAMEVLKTEQVDLMFLDIQMPEMTGTDFVKTLSQKPLVVFTTAYAEYAIESYELEAIDYLLKPFSFDRFVQAVNKADELIELKKAKNDQPAIKAVSEQKDNLILVKSEHKIYRIQLEDISHIQSMREYVAYYTPSGRILSLGSLKSLEESLPSDQFIRIHKSYIVAKKKVTTLEGNLLHLGAEKIPIGASYREKVLKELF